VSPQACVGLAFVTGATAHPSGIGSDFRLCLFRRELIAVSLKVISRFASLSGCRSFGTGD
jgi:hypothetical protein